MLKEFKDFALRGNVMDMAVGIIIGGAFGKIVASLVKDVLMPVIGKAMGGLDVSGAFINLGDGDYETLAAAQEAGASVLTYGVFMQTVIDFVIIAFAIFMMVKWMNRLTKKEEAAAPPPAPPKQEVLLEEIRDLLKQQAS